MPRYRFLGSLQDLLHNNSFFDTEHTPMDRTHHTFLTAPFQSESDDNRPFTRNCERCVIAFALASKVQTNKWTKWQSFHVFLSFGLPQIIWVYNCISYDGKELSACFWIWVWSFALSSKNILILNYSIRTLKFSAWCIYILSILRVWTFVVQWGKMRKKYDLI